MVRHPYLYAGVRQDVLVGESQVGLVCSGVISPLPGITSFGPGPP